MNRLIVGIGALALLSAPAFSADLPARTYTKAPMIAPAYNWTGWYVGANVGYGWGRSQTETFLDPTSSWAVEPQAFRDSFVTMSNARFYPRGVVGGIQAGYNLQSGSWLLGVEADFNGSDVNRTIAYSGLQPGSVITRSFTQSTRLDWFATFRPRVGYVFDRTLWYVTGGLAVGELEGSWQLLSDNGYAKAGSGRDTRLGWTAGAGVEHAFASNWSLKLEYLYTDLDNVSYASVYLPGSTFAPPGANYREQISQDLRFHTMRVGLNYKFGAPSVAKY